MFKVEAIQLLLDLVSAGSVSIIRLRSAPPQFAKAGIVFEAGGCEDMVFCLDSWELLIGCWLLFAICAPDNSLSLADMFKYVDTLRSLLKGRER